MIQSKAAYHGLDNLRVIATIAVIVVHASAGLVEQFGKVEFSWWATGMTYNIISRFAVPIFVMISGALLLSKDYPLSEFLRKRVIRIVLPFLFYALFYLLYYYIIRLLYGHQNSPSQTFDWLVRMIRKGVVYHFWFVYMIISLYLFAPIIGRWIRAASEKEVLYFLGLWMISNLLTLPFFKTYHFKVELSHFTGYIGYFVLGYYLSNKEFTISSKGRRIGLFLFVLGTSLTVGVTLIWSYLGNAPHSDLVSYFYPNLIITTIGIYLFFKYNMANVRSLVRMKELICKHSFGIFLIHILVLKWLSMVGIHWNFTHPAIAIPLTSVLCLAISTLFAVGVSKLPYGKYISG